MATKVVSVGALVLTIATLSLVYKAEAQVNGCTQVLMTLTPCLNYVSGNTSSPSSTCCSTLATVVQSQPQCLCLLLNGAASSYGYNINQTLALALPGVCNVQTPSLSQCNAASPSSPPSSSPPPDSSDGTATPPTDSSDGTATPPADSSDGTTTPPADSSDGTPTTPATSSNPTVPSGSKAVPTPGTNASDGAKVKEFSTGSLLLAAVLASIASGAFKF